METKTLDKIGFTASTLCALHCAVLPLVLALLPSLGLAWLGGEKFAHYMIAFTFTVAITAMIRGIKTHKNCWPIGSLGLGMLLLVVAENFLGANVHYIFSAAGGFCLAGAHCLNRIFCKKCEHCCYEKI